MPFCGGSKNKMERKVSISLSSDGKCAILTSPDSSATATALLVVPKSIPITLKLYSVPQRIANKPLFRALRKRRERISETSANFGFASRASRLFRKRRANSLPHDCVFARLQHPDSNHQRVRIRRDSLVRLLARVWIQFNRRRPRAQRVDNLARRHAGDRRVEAYEQMWNMISNLWNHRLRSDGSNTLHSAGDEISALLVVALHRLFRVGQNPIDCGDHPHNLFLRNLHAAADSVSRIIVLMSRVCQNLSAQ